MPDEEEIERTDETLPESEISIQAENHRFMTEDEELQFAKITETTWELVQKSKERMEKLQKTRGDLRGNK